MSYPYAKLKNISIIKTGKLDSNAAVVNGEYPFFTCDPNTLAINEWAYDTEAVLLAGNNASGNYTAKYYSGKFNAYQRTYIIETSDKDILDIRFLASALNQQLQLLKTISSGSTTKFLTIRMLHDLDIPLPNIGIQRRIADTLSAYDDLIENNRKQIKLLEEAAQRLYKEWFVDLCFPSHEHTKIVDGVPEGWGIYRFSDKVDIMSGGTPKTDNSNYYNGTIPFYTPKDSDGAFFAFNTITNITEDGLNNCNSRLYPKNTVIVTARGTVGKTTLLGVPMAMNQSCYALKSDEIAAPYYLFFALNKEIASLKAISNGGVFNTIIVKTFDSIHIAIPSNDLIATFETLVTPIMEQIQVKTKENFTLSEVRDRLLPKLMSGEVEV
ncbi:hypothetical protein AGATL06_02310 [Agathobaculum sp. TL06]